MPHSSPPDALFAAITHDPIASLQLNLRRLGYLRRGIDGAFGPETRRAVMAIEHDLLHNDGRSRAGDGPAPVRMIDYNRGRIRQVTGRMAPALLDCIAEMIDDPAFPKLPFSTDPEEANRRVAEVIRSMEPGLVPPPFLAAVLQQESGLMHYRVPRGADRDSFIVVGTDTNAGGAHIITSRGYGAGQYTLFHHPPRPEEVDGVMLDPVGNVERAAQHFREKMERFVRGPASRADDRIAERGSGPVVLCRYESSDSRFMRDCVRCAAAAGVRQIQQGQPLIAGSAATWQPTQYYASASYRDVPRRERLGCDWPYAVRRYNGAGINSYHYQARVLRLLARQTPWQESSPVRADSIIAADAR